MSTKTLVFKLLTVLFLTVVFDTVLNAETMKNPSSEPLSKVSALESVRKIFVDPVTGGPDAAQMRDLLIASLQRSGRFQLTENPDKADHFLRGAAEDLIYQDQFDSNEGVNARASIRGLGRNRSSLGAGGIDMGIGETESTRIRERKHEAMATVRLVNRDGDVIWATTQESQGAKFRSAAADVAERVVKQLLIDLDGAGKSAEVISPGKGNSRAPEGNRSGSPR
jgi:hypothetical protein